VGEWVPRSIRASAVDMRKATYIHGEINCILSQDRSRSGTQGPQGMQRTHLFESDNDQAVMIPADIAYADTNIELEITRIGDVITIFPMCVSLTDAVAALRALPKPLTAEEHDPIDMPARSRD
jgi:antitoxin VapB